MKKIGIMFLLICSLISTSAILSPARAADWGVGLVSNIAWWQPSFRSEYENFEIDPLFLWGPALSVSFFERWSLSVVILQNAIPASTINYEYSFIGSQGQGLIEFDGEVIRGDLDVTLSFALNNIIRFFCGYKYFILGTHSVQGAITQGLYTFPEGTRNKDDVASPDIHGNSAALGVNFSIPLFHGISCIINTSLLYSYLTIDLKEFYDNGFGYISDNPDPNNYHGIGANGTLSFSYFIESISTSVSVGGRFQYLTYSARGDAPDLADDYFYGILVSAMYLF